MSGKILKQMSNCDLKTAAFRLAKESQGYILRTEIAEAVQLFLRLPCPETAVNLIVVWPEMLVAMTGANDYLLRIIPKEARGPQLQGIEELMESFDFNLQTVADIQAFISKESMAGRVMVGFHRMRDQAVLSRRLDQIGIKKGLFSNRRNFLRKTITQNLQAFRVVNDMVSIHGIHDGRERFWNGLGEESDPQFHLQSEILYEISQIADAFVAVLDEIKRTKWPNKFVDGDE